MITQRGLYFTLNEMMDSSLAHSDVHGLETETVEHAASFHLPCQVDFDPPFPYL